MPTNLGKNKQVNPYPLILASTSKYRKALMEQLDWVFSCVSPDINEDDYKNEDLSAEELALKLSRVKAEAVFKLHPDSCVIGPDQVCSIDGMILDKPLTKQKAMSQLKLMQGRSHELISAVSIISPLGAEKIINKTILHMRTLNDEQITRYIELDSPLDCAGSYKLESKGIKLFSKIEMTDQTSIIGLPLIELTTTLLKLGYKI